MDHAHHLVSHSKQQAFQGIALAGFMLILFGLYFAFSFAGDAYRDTVTLATDIPSLRMQLANLQDDLSRMVETKSKERKVAVNAGRDSVQLQIKDLKDDGAVKDKEKDIAIRQLQLEAKTNLLQFSFWMYKMSVIVSLCLLFVGSAIIWVSYHGWWSFTKKHHAAHHVVRATASKPVAVIKKMEKKLEKRFKFWR